MKKSFVLFSFICLFCFFSCEEDKDSDATIKSVSVIFNGSDKAVSPTLNDKNEFILVCESTDVSAELTVLANSSKAFASVKCLDDCDLENLVVGENCCQISIVAEDGSTMNYAFEIDKKRALRTNVNIASVSIDGVDLTANGTGDYVFETYLSAVPSLNIVLDDESASFDLFDSENSIVSAPYDGLAAGIYTIKVTAEDGVTVANRKLSIITLPPLSTNTNITSVTVDGADLLADESGDYSLSTRLVSIPTLEIVLEDEKSSFVVLDADGTALVAPYTDIAFGVYTIRVTAEDAKTSVSKKLTFIKLPPLGVNTAIKSVTVNGDVLVADESGDYSLSTRLVSIPTLEIVLEDEKSSFVVLDADGKAFVAPFTDIAIGVYTIKVTAEDAKTSVSKKLSFIKLPPLGVNTNIKSVSVDGDVLLADETGDYSLSTRLTVIPSLEILLEDEKSSFVVLDADGTALVAPYTDIAFGVYTIKVTAEDAKTSVSKKLTFIKLPPLGVNTAIKSVTVNGAVLTPNGTGDYSLSTRLVVIPTLEILLEDEKSSFVVLDAEGKALVAPYTDIAFGVYTIKVTAEDAKTSVSKKLSFIKLPPLGVNTNIKSVTVNGAVLVADESGDYSLSTRLTSIPTLEIVLEDEKSSFVVLDADGKALVAPFTDIAFGVYTIKVTAEDAKTSVSKKLLFIKLPPLGVNTAIKSVTVDGDVLVADESGDYSLSTRLTSIASLEILLEDEKSSFVVLDADGTALVAPYTDIAFGVYTIKVTAEDAKTSVSKKLSFIKLPPLGVNTAIKSVSVDGDVLLADESGDYSLSTRLTSIASLEILLEDEKSTFVVLDADGKALVAPYTDIAIGAYTIKVTAEDGVTSVSKKLSFIKLPPLGVNTNIKSVSVDGDVLLANESGDYSLSTRLTAIPSLEILLEDEKSTFVVLDADGKALVAPYTDIAFGEYTIKVTAEDGKTSVSKKLSFIKLAPLGVSTAIKSVTVNGTALTANETGDYSLSTRLTVIASLEIVLEDEKSSFVVLDADGTALADTYTDIAFGVYTIKVTAEDRKTIVSRKLTFALPPLSTNTAIKSMKMGNESMTPNGSGIYTNSASKVQLPTMEIALADVKASFVLFDEDDSPINAPYENLQTDTYILVVTAEDGITIKQYTIKIANFYNAITYVTTPWMETLEISAGSTEINLTADNCFVGDRNVFLGLRDGVSLKDLSKGNLYSFNDLKVNNSETQAVVLVIDDLEYNYNLNVTTEYKPLDWFTIGDDDVVAARKAIWWETLDPIIKNNLSSNWNIANVFYSFDAVLNSDYWVLGSEDSNLVIETLVPLAIMSSASKDFLISGSLVNDFGKGLVLKKLRLNHVKNVKIDLSEAFSGIQSLSMYHCDKLINFDIRMTSSFDKIEISNCPNLESLNLVDNVDNAEEICVYSCPKLASISLDKIADLKSLQIFYGADVEKIFKEPNNCDIYFLTLYNIKNIDLSVIPSSNKVNKLRYSVDIDNSNIDVLNGLANFTSLNELGIENFNDSFNLDPIANLPKSNEIKSLLIYGYSQGWYNLDVGKFNSLKNLESLSLNLLYLLSDLTPFTLADKPNLSNLSIFRCAFDSILPFEGDFCSQIPGFTGQFTISLYKANNNKDTSNDKAIADRITDPHVVVEGY